MTHCSALITCQAILITNCNFLWLQMSPATRCSHVHLHNRSVINSCTFKKRKEKRKLMDAGTGSFICLSVSDLFLFYFASNVCFPFLSFRSGSFSRKISCPVLFLSTPLCSRRWCDVPGFVPAGSVSSFSTLLISLLICLPVCLLGHFPSLRHVWGSTSTGSGCRTLKHASLGFPFHFSLLEALGTDSMKTHR